MQLDLEKVVLAHSSCFVGDFADVHGLLKAVDVLRGQLESRFGELDVEELRSYVERQSALVIGHERARLRGDVFCCLQAVLAFFASFKQIAKSQVGFSIVVQILADGLAGRI